MNCSKCAWFGSDNDRTVRKRCPNCGALLLSVEEDNAARNASSFKYQRRQKKGGRWAGRLRGIAWRGWRVWKTR